MRSRFVNALALLAWIAFLAGLCAAFAVMGHGQLALPDANRVAISDWLDTQTPTIVVFSVVRAMAFVASAYMLGCALLTALAQGLRSRTLTSFTRLVTFEVLLRANTRIATLSLVGTLTLPGIAMAQDASADAPILYNVMPVATPSDTTTTLDPSPAPVATLPNGGASADAPPTNRWTVKHGENLWVIAAAVIDERGQDPSPSNVTAYWQRLVEANHDVLKDPSNADLVFVGQVFVLPD